MKKVLLAAAAVIALPAIAQAQDVQMPGVYFGVEGGLNWMFNTTILNTQVSPLTGWAAGGKLGYDFLGPRIEVEGLYRQNNTGVFFGNRAINGQISQVSVMGNFLYDFNATGTIVPYIGAGAGVGFVDSDFNLGSTVFAFQGILGLGYNWSPNLRFNLEGRYFGTTNPTVAGTYWNNNNISLLASIQLKFGYAPPPPPPPPPVGRIIFARSDTLA
jgi:opacity protein-like surface antigen